MTLTEERKFILDWVESMRPLLYRLGGPTEGSNNVIKNITPAIANEISKANKSASHRRRYMTASMAFERYHSTV